MSPNDVQPLAPVYTAELFPGLHLELVELLRGLEVEAWARPTLAGAWRVRDVAAHLLDGDLRKLAGGRDAHPVARRPVTSYPDLVALIDDLNATGVRYAERLSPRLLTDLLEVTGRWVADHVAALPPHAPAPIPVAWADEERSENWMDIAREYTERWHHQMQIRAAVGAPGLLARRWLGPVLEVSVRAFRRAFRDVTAAPGTVVVFEVAGRQGGPGVAAWSVVREADGWSVLQGRPAAPAAAVRADPDAAWKLLFNALPSETARACLRISGDPALAEPLLRARAVMV